MKDSYDLIIIGSGIAGLAAALQCHQLGIKYVMVVGKTSTFDFPFQTTASESVHPGFETLLNMFSIGNLLSVSQRGRYSGIFTNNGYNSLRDDEEWEGYHLDKPLLLKGLFSEILSINGCYVIDKVSNIKLSNGLCTVICRSSISLTSRFIIDASGNSQITGKLLGEPKKYYSPSLTCSSALLKNIPLSVHSELQTSFLLNSKGWTWLAPEINCCCTWTAFSISSKEPQTLPSYIKDSEVVGYHIKNVMWRLYEKPASGQIIKVGEAAGIIDPAAGQGIINAFMSGIMAGDLIYRHISQTINYTSMIENYNEWYRTLYFSKVNRLREVYKNISP